MEALKQRILEHIADLLDEPTFDMDMRLKGLKDPLLSDKSELHLLMTDAAFKALCTYFNKQDQTKQCTINSVVVPKGTLPLSKFLKDVEAYEHGQQTHPIKRTPERMRTILCATHWCKEIAKRLTK